MSVLVTGGTGYIGSHTCVDFIEKGQEVIIMDNLCNSKIEVLDYIEKITGIRPKFYHVDLLDREGMKKIFDENDIDTVIHFAGLKAVGESVAKPIEYYKNNIGGTLNLIEEMRDHNCFKLVFSSSATVYGKPETVPIKEDFPLSTTNPYGTTKLYIEQILKDLCVADNRFSVVLLRYFNPIGAHESGLIGDDPNGIPNNLMPYVTRVAKGVLPHLNVFGNDYDTPDGTGVRDYIHVLDLAAGHYAALKALAAPGVSIYNLGTGNGISVLDIVNTFERVNNIKIPYQIAPRRPGDIAECYADASKAEFELGWKATRTLDDMCASAWNFESKHR
ncbi:MAG: UDP-glucose 4-epimerase GalE [Clostridia bacterium]|nr:UDP-glucose 4-epimerase GalE [Clostridia bacterium]MBR5279256.1 UDP-glucose 4-epimerase GalE [Clostridia bacterium]